MYRLIIRPILQIPFAVLGITVIIFAVATGLATLPGLTIVFMVLGVNYLGSGLREILDPKLRIG
jgi:ABC-type dipeptide/oligopeptide/nickel transport system permease subunit